MVHGTCLSGRPDEFEPGLTDFSIAMDGGIP